MTKVVHILQDLSSLVASWKEQGQKIALVPTMGALHAGHLSLIELARQQADKVIVSIFVNPMQFGPNEDLDKYPRHEVRDTEKVTSMHVDALYLPKVDAIYPAGFSTTIHVAGLSERLCGQFRPGHFDGVATVVAKLLLQSGCDVAVFGEKDYQQLQIIRRLVSDLNIPVEIVAGATMREADGLAMSSRNEYLALQERKIAPKLHAVLQELAEQLKKEKAKVAELLDAARLKLLDSGFTKLDYLELCDANNLESLSELDRPARLLVAAHLGKTRLIDNIAVRP